MAESLDKRIRIEVKKNIKVASFVLGGILGLIIESHTDEIARGKINTVETCLEVTSQESRITESFMECIEQGVSGGNPVRTADFEAGDSTALIDAYVRAQENEQGIELGRVAGWAVLGAGVSVADWIL